MNDDVQNAVTDILNHTEYSFDTDAAEETLIKALAAREVELLTATAAEVSLHAVVVGPYFNLVCKCGHRGTAVSVIGEFDDHVVDSILALAAPAAPLAVSAAADPTAAPAPTTERTARV